MSCVNPNSPEFKKILEIEPNFLLAEILYDKMMKELEKKSAKLVKTTVIFVWPE